MLLHRDAKIYRVIGTLYILAPLLRKSTHTNLSNLVTYRFGALLLCSAALLHVGALIQQKYTYNLTFWGTCPTPPYVCQAAGTSIIGGRCPIVNYRKALLLWGSQASGPHWAPIDLKVMLKLIQKWVPFTSKCSYIKALAAGAPPQTPPFIAKESGFRLLLSLTRRVENGVIILRLFKNGFHLHPNAPKSVGGWGSAPDPQ